MSYVRQPFDVADATWEGASEYTRPSQTDANATWYTNPAGKDIQSVWFDDGGHQRSADSHVFPFLLPDAQPQDSFSSWLANDATTWAHDDKAKIFTEYVFSPKIEKELLPIELRGIGVLSISGQAQLWNNAIRAAGSVQIDGTANLLTHYLQGSGQINFSGTAELKLMKVLQGTGSITFTTRNTVVNTWYVPKPMGWLYRVPFNDPPGKSIKVISPHVDPERKDPKYSIPWGQGLEVDENKTHLWNEHVVLDNFLTTFAGQFGDLFNRSYTPPWTYPTGIDQFKKYSWDTMNFHFLGHNFKYAMPDVKDHLPVFSWDAFNEYAQSIIARANQAPEKDLWWHIVWGPVSYEGKHWNCIPTWGLALAFDLKRVSRVYPEVEVAPEEELNAQYERLYYLKVDATWKGASAYTRPQQTNADAAFPEIGVIRNYAYDTLLEATYAVFFDEENRVQAGDDFVKKLALPQIQAGDTSSVWVSPTGSLFVNEKHIEGQDVVEVEAEPIVPPPLWDLSPLAFDLNRIVNTQCEWVPPYDTGPKDNYWELPDILPTFPPPEGAGRSLYLMNSASLVRASDSMNIGVINMSIDTDIDSWSYTFRATLGNKAALDLCKPTGAGPVEVVATINGNSFNMYIEGYSERGAFGKTSYSVIGRSIAAELAAPYAEPATLIHDAALNLSQLFDAQASRATATTWTAVWNAQDGLIPANTYSYQEKTPMECMVELANSVGAFVYHDPTTRTIYATPRYKKNPWDFLPGDEDIALDHSYIVSIGHDWKPTPVKNGIYVSGTTADGFLGKVQRLGSDGALLIPMVTDPLIVTNAIGRERGRYELNKTGKKGDYSLEMPISADVEIFLPGKVARIYTATENWYGIVMGVSIQAQRSSGGPTIVRQQVKLERHYE